jgi:hypothetical protein
MGLGKTLTMLANIVATLKEAANFQASAKPTTESHLIEDDIARPSKATLVLVPSHSKLKIYLNSKTYGATIDTSFSAH